MSSVTILIIDSSEIFRAGMCQRLSSQPDFRLLDCDPKQEPLKIIESNDVGIALLDIDNPISKGLELGREIIRHYPTTGVIILSPYYNDDELFEAINIGAIAYIDKRTNIEELVSLIRRASQGEYVINDSLMARPIVAHRVLKQFQEMASTGFVIEKVATPLTQREIQILSYIANGNTNKEVAHILGISDQTIKNHVSAILRKLNANDRAHAVAMAIQNHWITVAARS
jgi:DNA-binding NarL/FixJ family response regulator